MVLHHGKADYELTLWISSDCFFRMENDFCERSFRVGEIVMNENTVESDERAIIVQRGNKVLEPLSLYYPKELLKVSLSVASGDIIFQVENATFVDGGCQGRRTCKNHQSLLMPSEPVGVKIWAGWASEHGFVKISKDFILRPSSGSSDIHALAPLVIPRDSQSGTGDKDYLKARNSVVLERRKQQPEEELEIFEEPEAENQTELEEEEEEEEEILPAITAAGMKHLDTMTVHLRGVVHENVPSEYHDLFYLFLALSGLFVLYLFTTGVWRCSCRFFGLTSSGKSE